MESSPSGAQSAPHQLATRLMESSSNDASSDAGSVPSEGHAVRVAVRVRPPILAATGRCAAVLSTTDTSVWFQKPHTKGEGRTYNFDAVFGDSQCGTPATQESVFEVLGEPLAQNAFRLYNGCVLAYGQTGAGKSYSIFGDPHSEMESGLLPRVSAHLFKLLNDRAQASSDVKIDIFASFLEIYSERIYDLFAPKEEASLQNRPSFTISSIGNRRPSFSNTADLQVRMHPTYGNTIPGLTEIPVANIEDVLDLWDKGGASRTVGKTTMNATSSRSHAIFTIELRTNFLGNTGPKEQRAKLHFVDLAGSERQVRAGTSGERLSEGIAINQSLTTLSRVISALTSRDSCVLPPYRESKLTMLLRDTLSGNGVTTVLACVSPAIEDVEETTGTLEFASRCKFIKMQAGRNDQIQVKRDLLMQLQEEKYHLQLQNVEERSRNHEECSQVLQLRDELRTANECWAVKHDELRVQWQQRLECSWTYETELRSEQKAHSKDMIAAQHRPDHSEALCEKTWLLKEIARLSKLAHAQREEKDALLIARDTAIQELNALRQQVAAGHDTLLAERDAARHELSEFKQHLAVEKAQNARKKHFENQGFFDWLIRGTLCTCIR